MYASTAILAALLHRAASGRGQYIDLALLDVQVAGMANLSLNYLVSGAVPQRLGNAHPSIVPYQDFPTADGAIVIAAGNDGQFARLCAAAGQREWSADPRFAHNADRVANRDALVALRAAVRAYAHAHDRGVGGGARGGRGPVRPDQHPRRRVRRSSGSGARAGRAVAGGRR
jgi:crotonobetainyl-CoA:carnitine CoA-transferase CaiB-like acyl-CoA transferase